jgi:UDP-N-acetylglucosamine--N-acetylmuramyl-(pentapeptide) pyrophosphoryl-undecaprenol N-acetylglucosamine transferase
VVIGIWQSFWLLKKLKPSAIFIKGGFVGVPVGLVAGWLKIPYITHDSDALPGLANRLIAKRAHAHAVGGPKQAYNYPAHKTYEVGVPLNSQYKPVTYQLQNEYRKGLGISSDVRVICVTGGGLGAKRLNDSVAKVVPSLLQHYPSLVVLHVAGRDHEASLAKNYKDKLSEEHYKQVIVKGFVNDLYRYSAAADLVICRAGATQLAELAIQKKAAVVVPNPILTGGHQTKNAQLLDQAGAVKVVTEEEISKNPKALYEVVRDLLDHHEKRHELAKKMGMLAKPDAAQHLADIILEIAKTKSS